MGWKVVGRRTRKRGCMEWHQAEVGPHGEQGRRATTTPGGVAQAGGDARAWAELHAPLPGAGQDVG